MVEEKAATPSPSASLFWIFQTAGWAGFFVVNIVSLAWLGRLQTPFILGYAATSLAGFGSTLLIRAAWKPWLTSSRSLVRTAVIAVLSALAASLIMLAVVSLPRLLGPVYIRVIGPSSFRGLGQLFYWAFSLCLAWVLIYLGFHDGRAAMDRRAETARALAESESAELQQVRFRVNPAFLFGALATLRNKIGTDRDEARSLVTEMAGFLRYVLLHPLLAPVPPGEEFEALLHYLAVRDLESKASGRSEARLTADGNPETIPAFLFLLLAEKAMDMAAAEGPVRLRLSVTRAASLPGMRIEAACCSLEPGRHGPLAESPGLGLAAEFLRLLTESRENRFVLQGNRRGDESVAVLDVKDVPS